MAELVSREVCAKIWKLWPGRHNTCVYDPNKCELDVLEDEVSPAVFNLRYVIGDANWVDIFKRGDDTDFAGALPVSRIDTDTVNIILDFLDEYPDFGVTYNPDGRPEPFIDIVTENCVYRGHKIVILGSNWPKDYYSDMMVDINGI